jgi:hypothetical protein
MSDIDPNNVVEKYLEIDDFLEYIIDEIDLFIEHEDALPKEEEEDQKSQKSNSASDIDEDQKAKDKMVKYLMTFL